MADDTLDEPVWVYKITCMANDKAYIGVTKNDPLKRWREHIVYANSPAKPTGAFQNAIRKHGAHYFLLEVLYHAVNYEEASVIERGCIASHNTFVPNGYNLSTGGEYKKFVRRSIESREKLSKHKKGVKLSDATREKMSRSKKNVPWTDAQRASISAAQQTDDYRMKMRAAVAKRAPVVHTDESKAKLSKSVKLFFSDPEKRKEWSDAAKKRMENPETRKKVSDGLKRYFAKKRLEKDKEFVQ